MVGHHHHATGPPPAESLGGFFSRLLDTDFVPREQCMMLRPEVIWLHVISDMVIMLAYYSIPLALVYFVRRRRDLAFNWMFLMFAVFILACGTTHLFNIIAVWTPVYRLDGVVKAVTGAASIGTALVLWPLIPKALLLPSPSQLAAANRLLEEEVERRRAAEAELRAGRDELELKVRERTEELERHRDHLHELVEERTAELRASHQKLRASERLASLGTLSAGLGHDLGNLLLPVRVRLEALEAKAPQELRGEVAAVRESTRYLGQLASGLRLLARDPDDASGNEESVDLRAWWQDASALLRTALPSGVELAVRLPEGVRPVQFGRAPLTQAVFNLVQNAADALRDRGTGGRVEVWAENATGGGGEEGDGGGADAEGVRIGVSDDGPGMSEEVRARCLEPFFTTKPRAISTGLGLPLVQGIVARAGGSIAIETAPGRGTAVVLTLRAAAPGPAGPRPAATVSLSEPRVRSFAAGVLEALGFDVTADGAGAPAAAALVWVVDGSVAAPALGAFLAGDERRRVVVYGQPPEGMSGARVKLAGGTFRPTTIREALAGAAREARPNS